MKFIVTRKNADGTFDDVGMNNRFVTQGYSSLRTMLRYGVPAAWRSAGIRVEVFPADRIYGQPIGVHYL